jgi:glycosyltransferase involved in cell wall biosynthesis
LASADSEVAALLRESDSGLTALPDDPAAIAGAVRALKDSPERRRVLGAHARDHVVRRYAKGTVLRSYDALLRSMVS